jgi:hypothetical protein
MWTSRVIWRSLSRWSNLAFTFDELQRSAKYHFCFLPFIKTKALSLVYLDPAHQALIDRIQKLYQDGLNSRQIGDHLNELGVTSWGGKRFYPELVFVILRKARRKDERLFDAVVDVMCKLSCMN